MALNLISFLLAFVQLFHSGGVHRAAAAGQAISFTAAQHAGIHEVDADRKFPFAIEMEDVNDIAEDTFDITDALFLTPQIKPVPVFVSGNKSFHIYCARSSIPETHLFLLHCNFRV